MRFRFILISVVGALLASVSAESVFAQYSKMQQPSTWSTPNGAFPHAGYGSNLSLVASQTQDVHRQMGGLLDQLRRAQGPQVNVATPFHSINHSFFERHGVGFGVDLAGGRNVVGLDPLGNPTPGGRLQFRQGGFNSAVPPFGGHDPAADATLGFRINGGNVGLNFNFAFGQGSTTTHTSQTPSVTIPNGGIGFVSDLSQRPFVTGLIPVVGGYSDSPSPFSGVVTTNPLNEKIRRYHEEQLSAQTRGRRTSQSTSDADGQSAPDEISMKLHSSGESSAARGDLSVAEIRRLKTAERAAEDEAKQQEILALIEHGRGAEEAGKPGTAKIYYQQAARRAAGDQQRELLDKIRALDAAE